MKLADLCLNVIDPWYLERHVIPSYDTIYCASIQDVMRDYADLADWMIAEFRGEPTKDFEYAYSLQKALRTRIVEVLTGKRV